LSNENNPFHISSKSLPDYNQQDFVEYINENKQWLKDNRISHHIKLLEKEVDELGLGGFSTGANLVTSYALENEKDISGLLLFSPGFASN
jgi:predicted esterase